MVCPLIHSAASVDKKPTNGDMSSVWPRRPCGHIDMDRWIHSSVPPLKNMSVATGPGATQLTVMRVPLSSLARILVMASTAALEAVYAPVFSLREAVRDDDSTMILPPPPRLIRFAPSLQHRNEPLAFTLSKHQNEFIQWHGQTQRNIYDQLFKHLGDPS